MLTPVDAHVPSWSALLNEPGLLRHAAVACFIAAADVIPGHWRPVDPIVARDWDGMWALTVHGHGAEHESRRWVEVLAAEGPAAVAADLVAVVARVRDRVERQMTTRRWEGDPADPTDEGARVSDTDVELLREGAAELDAWMATLHGASSGSATS